MPSNHLVFIAFFSWFRLTFPHSSRKHGIQRYCLFFFLNLMYDFQSSSEFNEYGVHSKHLSLFSPQHSSKCPFSPNHVKTKHQSGWDGCHFQQFSQRMSLDHGVTMEVSEKALLPLMILVLTCENGTLTLPNFQSTKSYNHFIGFLFASLKQFFYIFSLNKSHKMLWYFLSDLLFCAEESLFFTSLSSSRRLSIILIDLEISNSGEPWKISRQCNK